MRSLCLLLFLTLAAGALWGDTVYLTNGRTLEGRVRYKDDKIIVEMASGEVILNKSQVDYVEKKSTALDEFDARLAALQAEPRGEDFVALAGFAFDRGLRNQAQAMLRKAVETDPDNAAARKALGFEKVGGEWLPVEEANRSRGLVQHEGQWMSPEARGEIMRLQAAAARDRARVEADRARSERLEQEIALLLAERDRDLAARESVAESGPVYYGPAYYAIAVRDCRAQHPVPVVPGHDPCANLNPPPKPAAAPAPAPRKAPPVFIQPKGPTISAHTHRYRQKDETK